MSGLRDQQERPGVPRIGERSRQRNGPCKGLEAEQKSATVSRPEVQVSPRHAEQTFGDMKHVPRLLALQQPRKEGTLPFYRLGD